MSQEEQLLAVAKKGAQLIPEEDRNLIIGSLAKFKETFDPNDAIKAGDKLPEFHLTDATGKEVSSADLLAKGPLLITFYRGEWCPYCNVAIAFLQKHLDDFTARGVTLVAISPEIPNDTLTRTEKEEIKFPVLTDLHNNYARELGIVFDQSSARSFHASIGLDLGVRNGDDTWEVPIPATLLVDQSGVVRNASVEPDFTKRLDPKVALEWIDGMGNDIL
jgi:peroxiredoxin